MLGRIRKSNKNYWTKEDILSTVSCFFKVKKDNIYNVCKDNIYNILNLFKYPGKLFFLCFMYFYYFPGGSDSKASIYNVGEPGSIPGSGRFPGEVNGNPLQDSCLENPMDGRPGRLQSMGLQRVGQD